MGAELSRSGSERRNYNQVGPLRSVNILQTACESKSTECVKFLINEIMDARRSLIHDDDDNEEEEVEEDYLNMPPEAGDGGGVVLNARRLNNPTCQEFLTSPMRQVIFFELGKELATSNAAAPHQMDTTTYAKMINNTPGALLHLLNRCIYTKQEFCAPYSSCSHYESNCSHSWACMGGSSCVCTKVDNI